MGSALGGGISFDGALGRGASLGGAAAFLGGGGATGAGSLAVCSASGVTVPIVASTCRSPRMLWAPRSTGCAVAVVGRLLGAGGMAGRVAPGFAPGFAPGLLAAGSSGCLRMSIASTDSSCLRCLALSVRTRAAQPSGACCASLTSRAVASQSSPCEAGLS